MIAQTLYYTQDAALSIAEAIHEEVLKYGHACQKQIEHEAILRNIEAELQAARKNSDKQRLIGKRSNQRSKVSGAKRDQHRANNAIEAFKEALAWILLERQCELDGKRHPMPDVNSYLEEHQRAPAA